MAGENPTQHFEEQASVEFSSAEQIKQFFGEIDGFDDFQELVDTLEADLKAELEAVLIAHKANDNLHRELDFFEGTWFPTELSEVRGIIEKFPIEKEVFSEDVLDEKDQAIEAENRVQEEENRVQEEKDQGIEEKDQGIEENDVLSQWERLKFRALAKEIENLIPWVNFENDFRDFQISRNKPEWAQSLEGEFSAEDFNEFLSQKIGDYIQAAKDYSPQTFVDVFDKFSSYWESIPSIKQVLDANRNEYLLIKNSLREWGPSIWKNQQVEAALWVSNINDVDGHVIRWSGDELIDISGSTVTLSLEWADGMILSVWEVEKLDTRNQEMQISKLNKERQDNESKMDANEKAIWGLETAHSEFRDIPDEAYANDTFRERIAKKFSSQSPKWEAMDIFRAAESSSWVELKNMVLLFLTRKIVLLSNSNVELSQRNSEIMRDIGIFQAQIEAKRRLAEAKIYNKKEKVRQSQQFLEWIRVSRVIANASEIFAMIQPENPIPLPNGDIITGVNFSTMTFEGSFTPSLWEWGWSDIRTQQVLVQLMNKSLSAWFDGPMELTWNGNIVYRLNSELQDKAIFDSYVAKLTGAGNVEMLIQDNLFSSQDESI